MADYFTSSHKGTQGTEQAFMSQFQPYKLIYKGQNKKLSCHNFTNITVQINIPEKKMKSSDPLYTH